MDASPADATPQRKRKAEPCGLSPEKRSRPKTQTPPSPEDHLLSMMARLASLTLQGLEAAS
eukprot:6295122-Pyramimonas_sp.AAC.1